MTRKSASKLELLTVLCENYHLDKETGVAINPHFVLYSAPTDLPMAKSLAENLKRCKKSYRIVTRDGLGEVVDFWYRAGFNPTDERETYYLSEELVKTLLAFFSEGFEDWQEIQGSDSMDFPVEWDELMYSIQDWLTSGVGANTLISLNARREQLVMQLIMCFERWFWEWQDSMSPGVFNSLMLAIEAWLLEGTQVRLGEENYAKS